ncbi:MAG: flavin reductase [Bacilli bacterium]|nr:flavin reductase [Bacilli bacterium]
MALKAFRCGANVLAYEKNNKKYGMTCAWAMMVDYGKVMMLIGGQSETGNNLEVNDIVGISALACGQEAISRIFGMHHSSKVDKFAHVNYEADDCALLIKDAKVIMKAKVVDIKDLDGDHLITFEVLNHQDRNDVDFLDGYNPKCYHE